MLKMFSDRERTNQCDLNGLGTLIISGWEYYIVNKDSSNPHEVRIVNDSRVYAYGEGVHVEAYGNSCVTLFDGAVATLHDESMLMLDHNDPNNGYSEGGFRVYRDLRDKGMVGSFMYKWGSNTVVCEYPEDLVSAIWDFNWLLEFKCNLYVAFRGGDQPSLSCDMSYFEYESNEDVGFKVRLRDMTDQEIKEKESELEVLKAKLKSKQLYLDELGG